MEDSISTLLAKINAANEQKTARQNAAREFAKSRGEGSDYNPLKNSLPVILPDGSSLSDEELKAALSPDQYRREDRLNSPGWQAARGFLNAALPGVYVQPDLQGADFYTPFTGKPEVNKNQISYDKNAESDLGGRVSDALSVAQLAGLAGRATSAATRQFLKPSTASEIQAITKSKALAEIPEALRDSPELLNTLRGLSGARKATSGANALLKGEDVLRALQGTENAQPFFSSTAKLAASPLSPLGAKGLSAAVGTGFSGGSSDSVGKQVKNEMTKEQLAATASMAAPTSGVPQEALVSPETQFLLDRADAILSGASGVNSVSANQTESPEVAKVQQEDFNTKLKTILSSREPLKKWERPKESLNQRLLRSSSPLAFQRADRDAEEHFYRMQLLQRDDIPVEQKQQLLELFKTQDDAREINQLREKGLLSQQLASTRSARADGRRSFQEQFALNNPGVVPKDALEQQLGYQLSPEAYQALGKQQKGDDPMKMVAALLALSNPQIQAALNNPEAKRALAELKNPSTAIKRDASGTPIINVPQKQ